MQTKHVQIAIDSPDEACTNYVAGELNSSSGHRLAIYVDGALAENKK